MTKVIAVKLELDSGQSVESAKNVEKALDGVEQQLKDIQTTASKEDVLTKKMTDLKKAIDSGDMSFRQMNKAIQDYQTIAITAGRNTPIGKKALAEAAQLKDRIVDLNNEVKRMSNDGVKMQGALQIGQGVLGSYSAVMGATALMGVKNEELQKTLVKLQGAQAMLAGIEQVRVILEKESYAMMLLRNTATKLMTASQWALNIAMDANPIGLLIIALAATVTAVYKLTTAYDELGTASKVLFAMLGGPIGILIVAYNEIPNLIENIILKLKEWYDMGGQAIKFLLAPMMLVIKAYERLFGEVVDIEKVNQENHTNERKRHQDRLNQIDEQREKENKAFLDRQKGYDLEINRMDAEGKDSKKLKLQKLNDILDEQKAILNANQLKLQSWIDYYTNLAQLNGQSEEEFKKNLRNQGIDLDNLLDKAIANQQKYKDAIYQAETDIIKAKNEGSKTVAKNDEKALEDTLQRRIDAQKKLDEFEIQSITNAKDREIAILQSKFDERVATLDANIPEENELIKQYQRELFDGLENIEKKEGERINKLKLDLEEKRLKSETDINEKSIYEREDYFNDLKELQLDFYDRDLQALKQMYDEGLIVREEYDLLIEQKAKEHSDAMLNISKTQLAMEEQIAKDTFNAKLEQANKYIEVAQMGMDSLNEINNFANQIGENRSKNLERQKQRELNVTGLSEQRKYEIELAFAKKQDEIAKKQFLRDKALRIAEAGINTATAILKAIASYGPPPSPLGIAGIASAGAIGLAQIGTILATKFEPSALNVSPPQINTSIGGGSGSGGGSDQPTGTGNNNNSTLTDRLLNGFGSNENKGQRVYVLSSDISNVQNDISYVNNISSI